jgi:hyperosmotically inducible protein
MRLLRSVAAAILAGLVSATAFAQSQPSDEQIRIAIVKQLQDHNLRRGKLDVSVNDGVVTLAGPLQNFWEKTQALKYTFSVKGVKQVLSDIEIGKAESDAALAKAIGEKVLRFPRYTVYDDIGAYVKNGAVRLSGWVTDPSKSDELAENISKIRGVQDLTNDLKAYPPLLGDERLRLEVARRIFNDADFQIYAIQANPPIHVIVVYGKVTLKGYVHSQLERQKAEVIARGIPNVMGVDNQLQLDK